MQHTVPVITADAVAADALSKVRVLYTDLDGTLVAKGGSVLADAEGNPSIVTAQAIVALRRAGVAVVPISGRGRPQLRELTQLLGWDGYIAEAGGILVHGTGLHAEIRYDLGAWPADRRTEGVTPFSAINEVQAAEALMQAFPGRIEHYAPWQMDREVSLLLRGCLDVAEGQAVLDTLPLELDLVDNGALRSHGTLSCTDRTPHAFHVVPRGVSKKRAIELDLAWRGLTRENAAAIGDSATDLEMADAVAVMALVNNALSSAGVLAGLTAVARTNVWRTERERSEGWAEFASAWLAALGV